MTENLKESTLPFSKGNEFYWPTDSDDSGYCLSQIPYATNKEDLFQSGEISEKAENFTKNWSFETVVKSVLYYHFVSLKSSRKKANQPPSLWFDWNILVFVFLNKNTSKKEILDIIVFFYDAPDTQTILGVKRIISGFSVFPFVPVSPQSLNNLLLFLKIDLVFREDLIRKAFKKKNLEDLLDFLITMECTVNTNLVLTEALTYYFDILENGSPSIKEIEVHINNILESSRIELESFDLFDMMDSSELVKSGASKISVFSFNETFLLSLIKTPTKSPLKIFELFEIFVYQTKQKSLFLIHISFEKGGELYQLISDFCLACEKNIKFYAKSDYLKSDLTLFSFVFSIIAGSFGLLLFFASSRSFSTRTSLLYQAKAKTLDSVAFTTTGISDEVIISDEVDEVLENDNSKFDENTKIVRTREPSFGSLIPYYSKNQVNANTLPITETQPTALQVSTPVRASQKFESTVRSTRAIPRNTTMTYGRTAREGLKGNYSVAAFRHSSIELQRVPFELNIPEFNATELEEVINKLEYEYPGTNVNVNRIYKKQDGVYVPTNEISLIGTNLRYRDCTKVKERFISFVNFSKNQNLALVDGEKVTVDGEKVTVDDEEVTVDGEEVTGYGEEVTGYGYGEEVTVDGEEVTGYGEEVTNQQSTPLKFVSGRLQGEHPHNSMQRKALNLNKGECGSVFVNAREHNMLTKERNYSMPNEIGYTPGTAGAFDLIDFVEGDNKSVIKVIFNREDSEALRARGYTEENLIRGYGNAFNMDRETVKEQIENLGVNDNMFLALNVNELYNTQTADQYDNFIKLVNDKQVDCKTACKDLNRITNNARERRSHARSVGANLEQGSKVSRSFNMSEQMATDACKRAYEYVAGMPGYDATDINQDIKASFFGNKSVDPISLEEAFVITKSKENLQSFQNPPKPLYGSKLYAKNTKRK